MVLPRVACSWSTIGSSFSFSRKRQTFSRTASLWPCTTKILRLFVRMISGAEPNIERRTPVRLRQELEATDNAVEAVHVLPDIFSELLDGFLD